MSGFEAGWLALREPADRSARDRRVLAATVEHLRTAPAGAVFDLGCGTGSTFRALDPELRPKRRWVFVDQDPALLDHAKALQGERDQGRIALHRADLAAFEDLPLDEASLVTASALFDLVSARFIEAFAARMRRLDLGLYAALTVDGRIAWEAEQALDAAIMEAFAEDQRRDKGFGPGLGGEAAGVLEDTFAEQGFAVTAATSDWVLGSADILLQDAFHAGFAEPARAHLSSGEIEEWFRFRSEAARRGARLVVGHRDMLAVPRPLAQRRGEGRQAMR